MHARPEARDMRGANEEFFLVLFARTAEMRFGRRTSIDLQGTSALARQFVSRRQGCVLTSLANSRAMVGVTAVCELQGAVQPRTPTRLGDQGWLEDFHER